MKRILLCVALTIFSGLSQGSESRPGVDDEISSVVGGVFDAAYRGRVAPAFIDGVNTWLRRYEPRLLSQEKDRVRMQANYDSLYDIELVIRDTDYEIAVRPAQQVKKKERARKVAAHLSQGVHKAMDDRLIRDTKTLGDQSSGGSKASESQPQ